MGNHWEFRAEGGPAVSSVLGGTILTYSGKNRFLRDKSRSRETIEKLGVQSRDDGGLDQGDSGRDRGKKQSDSRYILKGRTIENPEGLDVGYENN